MVAHVVEVIFVDHICDFVQLYAGLLRVDFGLPAEVDHDDTFVCGVDDEYDGERYAASRPKQNGNRLGGNWQIGIN